MGLTPRPNGPRPSTGQGAGGGGGGWGRGQAASPELVGQPQHKVKAALLLEVAMQPGQEAARGPGPDVVSAGVCTQEA